MRSIWQNYRDESFINQYLSPRLIREFKLFAVSDKSDDDHVRVDAIHDEAGYRQVRADLAASIASCGRPRPIRASARQAWAMPS